MSIFMQYQSIRGDARDANGHDKWIDIQEFHFQGIHRDITSATGTRSDRESANADLSEIELIRYMDRASPELFLKACCGKGNDMTLHLTNTTSTGSGADTYLQYILRNALISRYAVLARCQSRRHPAEKLRVSFIALEMRYVPYDDDGNMLAPIAVGYSKATNTLI